MAFAQPSSIKEGYAHLPGLTRLAYSKDGDVIYTASADCMMRSHKVHEENYEPGFIDTHTKPITALVITKDSLITTSTDSITRRFSYPDDEFAGILSRAAAVPARWLSLDAGGERVAICSDELMVKIVNILDPTKILTISGLQRQIRSATWHTVQSLLTIITADGKVLIYEVEENTTSCLKTIEALVAAGKPEDEFPCAVAWHPKGDFFVVPTRTHDIAIIERDTWRTLGTFAMTGHDGEIGLLAWSPNGAYLASSGRDELVIVWETESRRPVSRTKVKGIVTSLEFSPTDNALSWATNLGEWATWIDPIPLEKQHPSKPIQARTTRSAANLNGEGLVALGDNDGDLAEDDDDEGEDLAGMDLDGDDDGWIVDDEGGEGKWVERGQSPGVSGVREVVGITKAQPAFQPGSTKMRNKKRYLAFNMIGVVDVTNQDTHHVVNVEFHDKGGDRRGYHFQDHNRFHLADIGEQGIVYASKADSDLPAIIHYRAYDTWASGADWQVNLPSGEEPVLIASGGKAASNEFDIEDASMGSVIVSTSKGYIRFFTGSGVQRYLWRMGEEMVSIAAGEEMAIFVHREGGTSLDGCQNLRYTLIDLDTYDIVQEGRLPLPKKTTLSWIGFTKSGAPAMYDSAGLLSVLDRSRRNGQARWCPVLDTNGLARKIGKSEHYWPVGMNETHLMCIILKGNETEPFFPRPVILDIDISLPLLNADIAQGQKEEKLLREDLHLNLMRDIAARRPDSALTHEIIKLETSQDKELLVLVQAACKADKLQRALDLVRLMNNPKNMEAAGKVAAFYHLPGLQEKIGIIREAAEEKKRVKESRERYGQMGGYGYGNGSGAGGSSSYRMVARETPVPSSSMLKQAAQTAKQDLEFAPRTNGTKRSARASLVNGDAEVAPAPVSRYVSETPEPSTFGRGNGHEFGADRGRESLSPGPGGKRKRGEEEGDDGFKRPHLPGDSVAKPVGTKNPFAKKTTSNNPFAKSNAANNTSQQAKKSYSFFERVDDAEKAKAAAVAAKNGKSKDATKKAAKQTALSFAPKPANTATRPVPVSEPSLTSTIGDDAPPVAAAIDNDGDIDMDTDMNGAIATGAEADNEDEDEDLEETQTDVGAGGEGRKRIVASPEWMGEEEQREGGGKVKGSVDDDEPLEWEESDQE